VIALSLEEEIDLTALTRRVVASLRPPPALRDDLLQQAAVLALDLLRRFHPRTAPEAPEPRIQAERYLFVSLQWNLRAYLRRLRSSLAVPESDRRLARAHARLAALQGELSLEEAAAQLGVTPARLAAALAATDRALSLDHDRSEPSEDRPVTLAERVAAPGPGPEEQVVAAVEEERAERRRALLGRALADGEAAVKGRQRARRMLYLLLDQLQHGDAEVLRLAFALPRKELDTLRSCRAYGCRREGGHQHRPGEIARWLQAEPGLLSHRLEDALEQLGELLGGRDPRRILRRVSAGIGSGSVRTPPGRGSRDR
jgi:hypothetical protein